MSHPARPATPTVSGGRLSGKPTLGLPLVGRGLSPRVRHGRLLLGYPQGETGFVDW
jgi:hypothetical protein